MKKATIAGLSSALLLLAAAPVAGAQSLPVSGSLTLPSISTPPVTVPPASAQTPALSLDLPAQSLSTPTLGLPGLTMGGGYEVSLANLLSLSGTLLGLSIPAATVAGPITLTTPGASANLNAIGVSTPTLALRAQTLGGETVPLP